MQIRLTYCPKNCKEPGLHFTTKLTIARRIYTQRESKHPPSYIKWELSRSHDSGCGKKIATAIQKPRGKALVGFLHHRTYLRTPGVLYSTVFVSEKTVCDTLASF